MSEQMELPGTAVKEDKLVTLVTLAQKLEEHEQRITELETETNRIKEQKKQIDEVTLPDLMREIGLTELTLASGRKIAIKTDWFATISKDRNREAMAWLREHQLGGIIETMLIVPAELETRLTEQNTEFSKIETIHPQRLKSLVKEQCSKPDSDFPRELFGVFEMNRAVVKG